MTRPRIGSLFSGYLGLDLAVREVFPEAETAFVADIDPGACKVLAHRAPEAPNLGDVSAVDWSPWAQVIAILTAGFPCQDVSAAGKRAGLMAGTRTGLWHETARAIRELCPSLVLLENVRGLLSARGDDPTAAHVTAEATAAAAKNLTDWINRRHAIAVRQGRIDDARSLAARRIRAMGCRKRALDRARRHEQRLVRAIGTVLGSLADLGFDAAWCGLRAADVDAPHGRWRIFILAWPADAEGIAWGGGYGDGAARDWKAAGPADANRKSPNMSAITHLLPTPAVNDMGAGKTPEDWDAWTDRMKAEHGNGNGHGASLSIEAMRLLPTPTVMDHASSGGGYNGQTNVTLTDATVRQATDWGKYAAAIRRWEMTTRSAPAPTEIGPKGNPRLSCHFDEWLMGLPAGWVTEVPDVTHNEALKLCGNGVVPQQGAAALRWLLTVRAQALGLAAA